MRIRFGDRRVASRGASAEPTNVFGKLGMTLFFLLGNGVGSHLCRFAVSCERAPVGTEAFWAAGGT